ncbi:MAG: hypothetical protein AAB583_04720 [Patescibacteria group bacterium]
MKKDSPIILKDSEDVRNIVVKVDIKGNKTTVFSGFSPWENLALLLEALGATVQKCIKDGINKKKVYNAIKDYMVKVLSSYKN